MSSPRLFVVADFSPFRPDWVFYPVRGVSEARGKAKRWVGAHRAGQAVVLSVADFHEFWLANAETFYLSTAALRRKLNFNPVS